MIFNQQPIDECTKIDKYENDFQNVQLIEVATSMVKSRWAGGPKSRMQESIFWLLHDILLTTSACAKMIDFKDLKSMKMLIKMCC